MSDIRRVARDNSSGTQAMTTAASHSRRMLVALTQAHHRGPTDTWTAARDRAAKAAGIERSYATRLWSRWQDMKDVSGEVLIRLSAAYVALCEASEDQEARLVVEGERIARDTADEIMAAAGLSRRAERVGSAGAPKAPSSPQTLP